MSEYRDSDYTLRRSIPNRNGMYLHELKLENNQQTIWRWVNAKYVKKAYQRLEFKVNGIWEGKPWTAIQINPKLSMDMIKKQQQTDKKIVVVEDENVRDYDKWNKGN